MKIFSNRLRKMGRLLRTIAGTDVYSTVQVKCPKLYFGDEFASWCICPASLTNRSVVYSFGIGENVSFDLALIREFGMQVHAFDPTPRSAAWIRTQKIPDKFIFHDYGVGAHDGRVVFHPPENPNFVSYSIVARSNSSGTAVEAPVYRVRTIMGLLGHERIDLLKMDVEGAEYDVIADLLESRVEVGQLLVEFHHRWPEVGVERTRQAISSLNNMGYRIFNVSPVGSEYSFLAT
jgi:FkbM family methyltransferase